jgi:hypothetical protein
VTFVHDQKIGIAKERSEILDTLPIIRIFLTIVKDRRRLPRLTSLHRPMGRGFDTEDRMERVEGTDDDLPLLLSPLPDAEVPLLIEFIDARVPPLVELL